MRFASLGSGSEGNGLVVEAGETRVLMDCGFGLADSVARLVKLGLQVSDLAGIVVTHEHSDHIGGVGGWRASTSFRSGSLPARWRWRRISTAWRCR